MPGAKRILIVEDEPLIAMLLEDFIAGLECEVAGTADNVAAALRLIESESFDLAILDVNLRDGEQSWPIADALAERGKPFLLATGGSTSPPPERHAGATLLDKPYTMDGVKLAMERLGG